MMIHGLSGVGAETGAWDAPVVAHIWGREALAGQGKSFKLLILLVSRGFLLCFHYQESSLFLASTLGARVADFGTDLRHDVGELI